MQNWEFLCEHCHEEGAAVPMQISYQGHDGSLLDAKERDQRVATAKRLQVVISLFTKVFIRNSKEPVLHAACMV